ncbi:XRE family transcriptional regulator [Heyndrickxia shackletonii]|uniref:XRE family transcriptional regulator n=1 Tax=Heyndrickxia shackletonii TaxID=157838 RepID=A0A0Q3WRY1_9BACI|nr:XRE family transcriptional regulator [Heyndrickxia shackletonii]KQL50623.1 XRE family transcriptional regulator [Heyndrickxia shackletonii]NEY98064.1 helix-turn-helix domain-containing protein [Heyndrickxia shackletonii]
MDKNFLSVQIGQRLRFYRQQRKLSLDEVAEITGVSKPMLGQIERGTSNPTVAVLWKIAAGLQVPIASFLMQNPSIKYLPMKDQPFLKEDNDLFETYNTFASPGIPLENYHIRMMPGCTHHSEAKGIGVIKIVTVYTGSLSIEIGDEEYTLEKGDAISFSTDVDQMYRNLKEEPCEFNMVIHYSNPQFI